jgi:acetyl esterase/lipase
MTTELPALRRSLPERRQGKACDEALRARREATGGVAVPEEVAALPRVGGVPCVIVGEESAPRIILHLHGGGYRLGSAAGWKGFARRLAVKADARIILAEYALAPERPFPAAIVDALTALTELLATVGNTPVFLSGDSAGGGLALAAASALKERGRLAGLILLSPWIDLRLRAGSYFRCAGTDALFSHAAAAAAANDYLQGWPSDDDLASPLLADLAGLPPTCVIASSTEVLADDSVELVRSLAAHNVPLLLLMRPGLAHDWPCVTPEAVEADHALGVIANFVASDLSRPKS